MKKKALFTNNGEEGLPKGERVSVLCFYT